MMMIFYLFLQKTINRNLTCRTLVKLTWQEKNTNLTVQVKIKTVTLIRACSLNGSQESRNQASAAAQRGSVHTAQEVSWTTLASRSMCLAPSGKSACCQKNPIPLPQQHGVQKQKVTPSCLSLFCGSAINQSNADSSTLAAANTATVDSSGYWTVL